jgi:hypothetical protein
MEARMKKLSETVEMISQRTREIEANGNRGANVESLYASRGELIEQALSMGAQPAVLAEITGNGRGL